MGYELDGMRVELDELMARLQLRWERGELQAPPRLFNVNTIAEDAAPRFAIPQEVETLRPFVVWTCAEDGSFADPMFSAWTWDEAIRYAKGLSIVGRMWTRVQALDLVGIDA